MQWISLDVELRARISGDDGRQFGNVARPNVPLIRPGCTVMPFAPHSSASAASRDRSGIALARVLRSVAILLTLTDSLVTASPTSYRRLGSSDSPRIR